MLLRQFCIRPNVIRRKCTRRNVTEPEGSQIIELSRVIIENPNILPNETKNE